MSDQNFSSAEDRNNNSPSERKDFNPPWQEQEVKKEESPPVPDQRETKVDETQTVFSPTGSPAQSPENPVEEKSELNYQAEPGAPSFAPEVEEKAKEFLSQDNSSDSQVNDSQTKPKGEVFKKIILRKLFYLVSKNRKK